MRRAFTVGAAARQTGRMGFLSVRCLLTVQLIPTNWKQISVLPAMPAHSLLSVVLFRLHRISIFRSFWMTTSRWKEHSAWTWGWSCWESVRLSGLSVLASAMVCRLKSRKLRSTAFRWRFSRKRDSGCTQVTVKWLITVLTTRFWLPEKILIRTLSDSSLL